MSDIARTDTGRAVLAEAQRWPSVSVSFHKAKRGHPHILVQFGEQSRKVFVPSTSCDWTGPASAVRDMRAMLREMGATPSDKAPTQPKERDRQPPRRKAKRFDPTRKPKTIIRAHRLSDPAPVNTIMAERLRAALSGGADA